ncbi:fumarylacetoacetate hydrolase family protein [Clostridium sp. CX1]|uniref:fumarylacetoacetate hydrolase family protein n=1 Tax=Clostridium sp. CX1 TaxID=2978346 RepID=UPI0021BED1D0|nr:fumarylacetoacetate hydrolase family protein [Clostridium sp. CX1]MCT8977123.1 fumarylacetoacetate hydrolase family protein [Clostridium sp. CX1]
MRFATFVYQDCEQIGIILDGENSILCLKELFPGLSMMELIANFNSEIENKINTMKSKLQRISLNSIILESPIPNPPRGIICLGKNYKDHVKEVAKAVEKEGDIPEFPIYFSKLVDRCVGHNSNIPSHKGLTEKLDYEVELAIIIGKEGKNIPMDKVEDYIFGYTILNDISVRDSQWKHSQWFKGKSFNGTCPMGPWIVSKDELRLPLELDIKCFVNGELRQNSNTREFIFDIPYIIRDFSKGITLKPGDVIATGTPAGVGMGFTPPKYLNSGDQVHCYIEGIGSLKNEVL